MLQNSQMMTDQIDIKLLENNCFEDLILKAVVQILNNVAAVFLTKIKFIKARMVYGYLT